MLSAAAEGEEPGAQNRKDSSPADLITKHLDGKRLVTMCELLSIKLVDEPPGSAPKLTIDTEYISRASRALAAMTLVKRASASETL